MLTELQRGLQEDLGRSRLLLPPEFEPGKMQFVKGEHLENCPYQYLDYPKHFLGEDKFTFRSLCWWGHHLVFAMIVEGTGQAVQEELCRSIPSAGRSGSRALIAPTLWEWKRGEGYTCPLPMIGKPSWRQYCRAGPGSRSPGSCRWIRRPCGRAFAGARPGHIPKPVAASDAVMGVCIQSFLRAA